MSDVFSKVNRTETTTLLKDNFDMSNEIVFSNNRGWILKLMPDKSIKFNPEVKLGADEFAKEFINILEGSIISRGD